jgi:hypothetical protein
LSYKPPELGGYEGGVLVPRASLDLFIGEIDSVLAIPGEISAEPCFTSEKRETVGCCKEKTCADSDTKGLEGGFDSKVWKLGGADIGVKGDVNDVSRNSVSLFDFVERFRHLKKLLLDVLFRSSMS